jgi:cystathionine gamma-lyase
MNEQAPKTPHIETLAVHAGQRSDPENGAVMTPVYFSSTFEQDAPAKPRGGYEYSRTSNPTRTALQDNLAALEGGDFGLCFASGLGATNALCARLRPGDHVLATNDLYGGTYRLFQRAFAHYGIEFTYVDPTDLSAVKGGLRDETRYLFLESPSNPLLRVCDIAACATLARERGALTVVDNTFATPCLQRPLELGADIVLHSLTKYMGGHSDVVGGALVVADEGLRDDFAFYQNAVGAQLGPMDAFLVLRGIKTLPLRMERHCANASHIAAALTRHPQIERVIYPGLESHPNHALASRQMKAFGGMLSFELQGGQKAADAFACATEIFTLAESLGGVESLVEVPASMTHASIPAEERRKSGLSDGLVRLSVGIEHVDDLLADVGQAIERSATPVKLAAH